jgi:hypothetical protein
LFTNYLTVRSPSRPLFFAAENTAFFFMLNPSFLGYFIAKRRLFFTILMKIGAVPDVPTLLARHSRTATPIGGLASQFAGFPPSGGQGVCHYFITIHLSNPRLKLLLKIIRFFISERVSYAWF